MMDTARAIMGGVVEVSLEAAPWLMLGLIAAGLVRALMPTALIARWLGGRGAGPVAVAALVGAPLPLCSCGVLPVAIGLRKGGASKGATSSFLVATPETGLDSIALSYALLGPFFAVVRPIAAIASAILTGLAVSLTDRDGAHADGHDAGPTNCKCEGDGAEPVSSGCCAGAASAEPEPVERAASCCSSSAQTETPPQSPGIARRIADGLAYSFTRLLGDIALWLAVGLLFAGVMRALVEPGALASLSGWWAMLAALVAGVPLYICASASTPIAAGLLATGVAPGVAVVLLLAGPATNIGSLGVIRKEIGDRATAVYVVMVALTALGAGLAVDAIVAAWGIDIAAQVGAGGRHVPRWIAVASALALLLFSLRPLALRLAPGLGATRGPASDDAARAHHE
ncbi:MAG: permease [Planctomycetota bacterium]|nr:MAG: permease [Planctomycetota bacterium]